MAKFVPNGAIWGTSEEHRATTIGGRPSVEERRTAFQLDHRIL
jgi:hypothetical protein